MRAIRASGISIPAQDDAAGRDDPTAILDDELPTTLTDPLAFQAQAIVGWVVRRLNLEEPA